MKKTIWGTEYDLSPLSDQEREYLANRIPDELPNIEWLWAEMDAVWDRLELDNRKRLDQQPKVGDFYSHPVWIANGIFSQKDPTSIQHRKLIAEFASHQKVKNVADFGGGSGVLAKMIVQESPQAQVDIIEPFKSPFFANQINSSNINYLEELKKPDYDLLIAQDVIEHVNDPILESCRIANAVKDGGHVLFANCFQPVIKCHLPENFYLRFLFPFVMKQAGLNYIGTLNKTRHIQIFQKVSKTNPAIPNNLTALLKPVGNSLNLAINIYSKLKKHSTF